MIDESKKVLVVSTETGRDWVSDSDGDDVKVSIQEYSEPDALMEAIQHDIDWYTALPVLLKNRHFVETLKQHGYEHIKNAELVRDGIQLTGKYFYRDGDRSYNSIREIDLQNVSDYDGEYLAKKGTMLFAGIKVSSLKKLCPSAHRKIATVKNKLAAAKKKRDATKKAKAAKKKLLEIEKAKKLLKEEGTLS